MRHPRFARYAAPVAFLAAVTIIVLLIRPAFRHTGPHTTPRTATTTTRTTTKPAHEKTKRAHHTSVRTYAVQSGDTFASIAQKTGTTVARLEQLNPGVSPTALQVGQKIRVR